MELKDVKANQGNIEVVVKVVQKETPRTFEKFGKAGKVCAAIVTDDSGQIKLTLWNEDIDKVNIGDRIKIVNGWCSEYKGEKQLSTGKFGKIEVLEPGTGAAEVFTNDPGTLKMPGGDTDDGDDGDGEETEPVDAEEFVD